MHFPLLLKLYQIVRMLTKELGQLKEQIDTLEKRFVVLNEITKSQYDLFMPELKARQRELEIKLENGGISSSNLKKSIKMALDYACNLPSLWELGNLETGLINFLLFISFFIKKSSLEV